MYCKNCGKEVDVNAVACTGCGCVPSNGTKFCRNCGAETQPGQIVCLKCGVALGNAAASSHSSGGDKNRVTAALLGIFLGGLGVHNFYLGFSGKAVIQIVVSLITCGLGSIWGLIEGIMILAGSINVDANGIPLGE